MCIGYIRIVKVRQNVNLSDSASNLFYSLKFMGPLQTLHKFWLILQVHTVLEYSGVENVRQIVLA